MDSSVADDNGNSITSHDRFNAVMIKKERRKKPRRRHVSHTSSYLSKEKEKEFLRQRSLVAVRREKEKKRSGRPWQDSNLQSPDSKSDALTIRPQGPHLSYVRVNARSCESRVSLAEVQPTIRSAL